MKLYIVRNSKNITKTNKKMRESCLCRLCLLIQLPRHAAPSMHRAKGPGLDKLKTVHRYMKHRTS